MSQLVKFRWIAGGVVLLLAVAAFIWGSVFAGIMLLAGGVLLVPPLGDLLAYAAKRRPTGDGPSIAFGVIFAVIGLFLVFPSAEQSSDTPEEVANGGEPEATKPPSTSEPQEVYGTGLTTEDKIGPYAVMPIEGEGWSKTRAAWGESWIKRINEVMPLAARKVAESDECDVVDLVGLSENRSVPRQHFEFYVDCLNGKRFYVSEDDAKSAENVVSKNAKTAGITDGDAISACEQNVQSQLHYPSTFDRHVLATSVYRAPTGNIAVEFDFDAKNGLGAELPHHARCVIDDRGIHPAEISSR